MRILYQSFGLPELLKDSDNISGGVAVEWYSWIKGIKLNNYEFLLLSYKGAKEYIGKKLDFEIIESYDQNKGIPILRWLYYRFPSFYNSVKKSKPDLIITEGASALIGILAIIGKLLNIPFVYRVASDPDVDNRLKSTTGIFDYYFYLIGFKLTKYIVAQNSYQLKKVEEKFPNKKIIILHNPYVIENKNISLSSEGRDYIALGWKF